MSDTDYQKKFEKYSKVALKLNNVSNDDKLFLYAHYKQINFGNNDKDKPSLFNLVEKAKWNAWQNLANKDKNDCIKEYINKVKELYFKDKSS